MPSIQVHQVLATLGDGDAIGHEVLGIQRVLRGAGFESEIFVQTAAARVEPLTRDYRELTEISRPDNILIHHFSIGSRASRIAYALPDRMILVYHNITPPEYFVGVHKLLAELCFKGRRELGAYPPRCDLALGDSEFNRQELAALGFAPTGVLPVVPDFTHLEREPNYLLAGQFDDEWTNILFVGRVIPNKRFDDLIRIFDVYKRQFNPRSRLLLVGSYGDFEQYLAMLQELVAALKTPDVHFTGHISDEELIAFYEIADLFLCASEHEGFCVPLHESCFMQVPVVAYAATAVPATMDGGGVLYTDRTPAHVASLIDAIISDQTIYDTIVASQDAALARARARDFAATLCQFVDQVARTPRRPRPPASFDFWDQLRLVERLDELRQVRPAAYHALPFAPDDPRGTTGSRESDFAI
jgi:glycosyltransferase involved in cell wall biosynthesis